jgi:hypothetical protein
VVVDDERGDTRHPPGVARVDAGEAVLALQLGDRSVDVTGRSAASARTDSASCFARSVSQGKSVSLIAAQMSA